MPDFRFYYPIEVRYADLDAQGHVNNASYLTYIEQARVEYLRRLGLWDGKSFIDIGIIVADVQVSFRVPILFGQAIRVGARVSHLGNKSIKMEYRLENAENGHMLAAGSTVLVAYDYQANRTIPVPDTWRKTITSFEGLQDKQETR